MLFNGGGGRWMVECKLYYDIIGMVHFRPCPMSVQTLSVHVDYLNYPGIKKLFTQIKRYVCPKPSPVVLDGV